MANAPNTKKSEPVVDDVTEDVAVPASLEAHEAELSEDELLADMPKLAAPLKLRIKQRNALVKLVMQAESFQKDNSDDETASKLVILDLIGGVDEWAESIAFDQEAYVDWAQGRGHETFLALMNRYSVALGK
jgi:hypothetical protein